MIGKNSEICLKDFRIAKVEPFKLRLKVGAEPVSKKGRPLSQEHAKIMKILTDDLLHKKVVRRSNSSWYSPDFLVGKSGIGPNEDVRKNWRKVVDYTWVNSELEYCHFIQFLQYIHCKCKALQE